MWDGEKEEPVARAARELQGSSARSMKSAEWSLSDGLLYFQGKIYVPNTSDLCRRIIALSHDSRLAGHSGRWKTLELVTVEDGRRWNLCLGLLVATDVKVCWQVCLHLWHVPLDQIIPMSSDWRTPPSSYSICSVGHHQCRLHCQAATICRTWFHHGCCRFRHKACTFHLHCHYNLCRWSRTPFPQPCVETSWSPSESHLR